jgi:Transposase DDE domain group 1
MVPAPTTAGQLMRRLNARQCQAAVAELARVGDEVDRALGLPVAAPVTLDLDSTDSEVYGRCKQGAASNHRGQRCYDSQLATWAERRRILAIELRSGNLNEHPTATRLLRRALKALPKGHGPVRARLDSGFQSLAMFEELRRREVGFTCSLQRSPTLHSLRLKIPSRAWQPALQMPQAEIAETTYTPQGWRHEPLRLIVRRVKISADELSEDERSRRRRTVPKEQLQFALESRVEYVYGYSFIFTDLEGEAAEIEHWHRQRAQMEERTKEVKLGDGLLHFPTGTLEANRAWQTAGVVAHNLVSLLSAVLADVNHDRLEERLEQSLDPPPATRGRAGR